MNQSAIFKETFSYTTINIYYLLYKNLPENTIAEKIIKIRKIRNLERDEFANVINHNLSTVQHWEVKNVPPTPGSILDICNIFNLELNYFSEYYYLYYNPPIEKIIKWKTKKGYTYKQCCDILDINYSTFSRLINDRVSLSYSMYIKLINNKIIKYTLN
ncbi:helix-turn-helix transcriptional regulator [Clostridium gasigenes]|uniref:helix-turn-helix domain-containing protein n=1 Tax=Clostridium gasigenes TaxID=94869 RepID=UPI001623C630|nr:helix-turn-helix transcriptional regulator [Clostridium gasigenes]MBB6622584.1 helix-turn-helix transcriptional regulator [Clostridium gasigenes]